MTVNKINQAPQLGHSQLGHRLSDVNKPILPESSRSQLLPRELTAASTKEEKTIIEIFKYGATKNGLPGLASGVSVVAAFEPLRTIMNNQMK